MNFLESLAKQFAGKPVDWDELEETLIRADLGVPMTMKILAALRSRPNQITTKDVVEVTREEIAKVLPMETPLLRPFPAKPKVILIIGVNGTGKTTSTAK